VGCLQESFGFGNGQDEGQLSGPLHGRHGGGGIAGAKLLGDQEAMQVPDDGDAAGNGGSGVATLIESSDIVTDLLQADLVKAEAVPIQSGKVAVEVVSVGVDGAGCGTEFYRKGIEPELGQPLIGTHGILLIGRSMARVTDFLSK
jgi:hypothetical protein